MLDGGLLGSSGTISIRCSSAFYPQDRCNIVTNIGWGASFSGEARALISPWGSKQAGNGTARSWRVAMKRNKAFAFEMDRGQESLGGSVTGVWPSEMLIFSSQ